MRLLRLYSERLEKSSNESERGEILSFFLVKSFVTNQSNNKNKNYGNK